MTALKCRNCGDNIRRTKPRDGVDPDEYAWVHVFRQAGGGEITNPICGMTLVAEPPAGCGKEGRGDG